MTGCNTDRIERVVDTMAKKWEEPHTEDDDPAFILAGNVPDYSYRLPDHYFVCVPLGTHGGVRVVYYSPRAFDVGDGVVTLHDGHLGSSEAWETEFEVEVGTENIVYSAILNPAGYTGGPLHLR